MDHFLGVFHQGSYICEVGLEEVADEPGDLLRRPQQTGYYRPDPDGHFVDFPQEIHLLCSGVFKKFEDGTLLPAVDGVDVGVVLSGPVCFVSDFLSSVSV